MYGLHSAILRLVHITDLHLMIAAPSSGASQHMQLENHGTVSMHLMQRSQHTATWRYFDSRWSLTSGFMVSSKSAERYLM